MVGQGRKVGGNFPTFGTIRWNEKEKNKGRRGGGKSDKGEKRKKGEERKRKIFSAFQWSKLDSPRIKVDPCNESYAWVQKLGSFVKLQEVGNFLTRVISSLKAI